MDLYPKVKVKLEKGAFVPERAHDTDAGADIRTPFAFEIPPHDSFTVETGVHIETPPNCVTMIKSKSGLNVKYGITSEGVIDEGYAGEIIVKLYNNSGMYHHFDRGDKITQIIIIPVLYPEYEQVDKIKFGDRAFDGFGSTGK